MTFSFYSDGIQWANEGSGGSVTPDSPDTFTNKTISADDNTISDLGIANFKDGTVLEEVRLEGASNDKLVTEKAVSDSLKTYIFEQGIASTTWVVTHNLNRFPSVVVVDSAGTQFMTQIHYDSLNQLTISMNGATTGKVYLN